LEVPPILLTGRCADSRRLSDNGFSADTEKVLTAAWGMRSGTLELSKPDKTSIGPVFDPTVVLGKAKRFYKNMIS
jgi:hypothetical protein